VARGGRLTYGVRMGAKDESRYSDPAVEAYKSGIDRTLIDENLRRTPEERIRNLIRMHRTIEELRRAMDEAKGNRR